MNMEQPEPGGSGADPFDPTVAPGVQIIIQMRIYDVLMAILQDANPEAAARLHQIHSEGKVLGALPWIDM